MTASCLGLNHGVSDETLRRLAERAGIQSEWWTIDGQHHAVDNDTFRHLLGAMSLPADSEMEAQESLDQLEALYRRPPVIVRREGEAIRLPFDNDDWLHIEHGDGETIQVRTGETFPALPLGRYRVLRDNVPETGIRLTIAPHRAWLAKCVRNHQHVFGIAAQLYALRRNGDQGIGDFATLAELARRGRASGANLIGINPLHALFPEQRERVSPYSPSDRRFVDPIYLDVGPLEEIPKGPLIDYATVWAAKEKALRQRFAHSRFDMPKGSALVRFATFNALAHHFPGISWSSWPAEFQDPDSAAVSRFAAQWADEVRFHAFLQHLCDAQLKCAAEATTGMSIGLYRDLAVGASPDGAEAWATQQLLARRVSIGAPPDPFAPGGQVWNLPPLNPHALAASGYDHVAELLAANMAHAGALRIDHAMALSRLFWVPDGADGRHGAYVSYPLRDLIGETTLASSQSRCMIVAEALGTVPAGFEQALADADMLSYRVALLERDGLGFRAPSGYPYLSLACITSHDLPTFAGWWKGIDIAERKELGQLDDLAAASTVREEEKRALQAMAAEDSTNRLDIAAIAAGVHAMLARAESAIAIVQSDDLALEEQTVNMPGTDLERPNWRRRLQMNVAGLFKHAGAAIIASMRTARGSG